MQGLFLPNANHVDVLSIPIDQRLERSATEIEASLAAKLSLSGCHAGRGALHLQSNASVIDSREAQHPYFSRAKNQTLFLWQGTTMIGRRTHVNVH